MNITEDEYFEGVAVDLVFKESGPVFGDLFTICGYENPNFPPQGEFPFSEMEALQFSQTDDYFGIQIDSDEGDDVAVWLYPIVEGQVVDHHEGPFTALRVEFNVLRNPSYRAEHFYLVLRTMIEKLPVLPSMTVDEARKRVVSINDYWAEKGVIPGSDEAMEIDC